MNNLKNLRNADKFIYQCIACKAVFYGHSLVELELANTKILGCPYCKNPAYTVQHMAKIPCKFSLTS